MKAKQRLLALILSVMMIITYMPGLAYAAAGDETEPAVTTDTQDETATEDAEQTEPAETEEPVDAEEPSEAAEPEVQSEEPEEQIEENEPAGTLQEDGETAEPVELVEKTQAFEKKRVSEESALPDKNLADNDDLLMDFLYHELSEKTGQSENMLKARGSSAGSRLSEIDSILYESLKGQIEAFVDPEESVTSETSVFDVPVTEILGKDLEQTTINVGTDDIDVYKMSNEDFEEIQSYDGDAVVDALLADMPYELYWFDKTSKYSYVLEPADYYKYDGDDYVYFEEVPSIRFSFKVSADYSLTGDAGTTEFDTSKIQAVKVAVKSAETIIASAKGSSDYNKLVSYRESICEMTSYNDAAAQGGIAYGDPWQLIYVFDGDDDTKVVCEGYSKAFQYLCDNTDFRGDIECVSVTGTMKDGESAEDAEPHMWNVVTIDNINYLVDVTNCDENTVGADNQLFLAGWSEELLDSEDSVIGYKYACNDGNDFVDYEFDEGQFMTMSEYAYDGEGGQTEEHEISYSTSHVFYEGLNGELVNDEYYVYYIDAYDGDVLTIDGKNYTYDDGRVAFINDDDSTEIKRYEIVFGDGNQENAHWTLDNGNNTEVSYAVNYKGNETTVTSVLSPKPQFDLTYIRGGTLTENVDGNWVEAEDDEEDWFEYFEGAISGDVLTVDGAEYTFQEKRTYVSEYNYYSEWGFFNDDLSEQLDNSYFQIQAVPYQSESHWILGEDDESKDFGVVVTYMGTSVDSVTTVVKNPVQTITYKRNSDFIENKNGYSWVNEDGAFFYYYVNPELGDVITINDDDEYVYKNHYDDEGGFQGFYNSDGVKLENVSLDSNQNEEPWVIPEDETETTVTFTAYYMGHAVPVEAKLIKNPIQGISYTPINKSVDLIEGIDGEYDEEDDTFRYEVPGFEKGDELTVSYRDRDDVTYTYTGRYFVNPDNSKDRIYNDWEDGVYITADQSDPWTLTEGDDYYPTVINYEGQEAPGRKIRIVPNPVESISFSRNGESAIYLIEGKDSRETSDEDEDTGEEYPYVYYRTRFQPGDILTVTYTGNRTCNYEYRKCDGYYDYQFVNIEDDEDVLDDEQTGMWANPEQSHTNVWEVNGTYTAEAYYMNRTAEVEVHILPNPVTKVEFEFADGSRTAKRVNGVDGEMDWDWISDGEDDEIEVDYFRYDFPEFKAGDKLIVTREGKEYTYVYGPRIFDGEYYRGAFVNTESDDVIFADDEVEGLDTNQSGESPWEVGGSGYYFEYEYYGVPFRIPAEVVENPVHGIDFERDGYSADSPIELTEGLDAEINSDGGENRWFEYFLRFKNGDKFKIVDKDGETSVYNAETYEEDDDDVRYFRNDSGETIDPYKIDQTSEQSSDNQWKPGDGGIITLGYFANTKDVNVKIVKNPVQKIDFVRPDSEVVELTEEGDGFWGDRSFCYEIRFRDGDELYVTYDGESEPVKYVASASTNGKVYEFSAEGTVPSGAKETISVDDISFRHNRDWQLYVEDDEQSTIMLMYQGMWTDVPVKIVGSNVESFEFVWAKGGDKVELTEGIDGSNSTYYSDEGDVTAFTYWLPFIEGDSLKVKYAGAEEPTVYVYSVDTDTFDASGTVPDGAPASIAIDDLDQRSEQNEYIQWEAGGDYEIILDYMGSSFTVPVTIVEHIVDPYDINRFEILFDESYLVNEEIETTPYPDYFYVVHSGTVLEPIAKDGEETLDPAYLSTSFIEQEFDSTEHHWGPKDGAEWSSEFPTSPGVYFCEVTGKDPYTGTYEGMLPLVRVEAHDWSDWTVTQAATCTVEGEETRTCSGCDATETRSIAVNPEAHDWSEPSYAWADDNSTCSALRYCGNNLAHFENETANAEHTVIKEATETENGEEQWTATFENEVFGTQTKTKTIPALTHTHSMTHTDAVAATCTEPGNSEYWYCSGCDKYFSDEEGTTEIEENSWVINALDHKYGEWEKYNDEQHKRVCTREGCDEVEYEAHTWNDGVIDPEPTETSAGVKTYTCTVCGETKTETVPALTHTHSMTHTDAVAATCTEPGNSEYWYCSGCGKYFSDEEGTAEIEENSWVINALDHEYGPWEPYNDEQHQRICMRENCGNVEYEAHRWNEGVITTPPTADEDGVRTYTCTDCGETKEEEVPYSDEPIASGKCGTNLTWTLDAEGTLTISGQGAMTSYSFVDVQHSPFYQYRSQVKKIVIEEGMTKIGWFAFYGFSNLQDVTIPSSVKTIGAGAFYASGIENIVIPDTVTTIEDRVFMHCTKLKSIVIPDGITTIDEMTFYFCGNLQSITIPASVTTIKSEAFVNCDSITEVHIEDLASWCSMKASSTPQAYSDNADLYVGNELLTDIVIPDGVTGVRSGSFANFNKITSVSIPDSVTSISTGAFQDCKGLTNVIIADGVTTIGNSAFSGCSGLTSITIPEGVTEINNYTFSGCLGLTSITIPDGVTRIRSSAFSGCSGLTSIAIPEGVTKMESSAFSGCSGLTSIAIPEGVTVIESNSFQNCTSLKEITIPDGVTSIEQYAFKGCLELADVTLPNSVTSIGDYAFNNCDGLTEITIPGSVARIGDYAFDNSNGLSEVTILDGVTNIGAYAFGYCTNLEAVTIPDSVTSIGQNAFYYCGKLGTITIPGSLTTIGGSAFYRCGNLKTVTILDGVTKIDGLAFGYCTSLEDVTIPDSVTTIVDNAFGGCKKTMKIHGVPGSEAEAFANSKGFVFVAIDDIEPHTHVWGEIKYEPNASKTQVTASRSCNDCGAEESETVAVTLSVTKATCENAGKKVYTSDAFENPAFQVWSTEEEIQKLGHNWNEPTYLWSADNTTVKATRTCKIDPSHSETETVNATSTVTKDATSEEDGTRTWTSGAFDNKAFTVQTKEEIIPKVVTVEEGRENAYQTLQTADEEVAVAKASSGEALGLADNLNEESSQEEIDAAVSSLNQAMSDAEAAMKAAKAAYEAAQAYYNAAEKALNEVNGGSAINGGAKRVLRIAAKGNTVDMDDAQAVFNDAKEKLAAAKYNNAAATNTLARSRKAAAMISMIQATQAIAEAEEKVADPDVSEADKAAAASAAEAAAANAVEEARKAETTASETESLVAYANADGNIEADRVADLTDLVSETETIAKDATDARVEAENLHLSAEEAAALAEAVSAAKTAKDKAEDAKKAVAAASTAVSEYKKAADSAKTLADKAKASNSAANVTNAVNAANAVAAKKATAEKAIKDANNAIAAAEKAMTDARGKIEAASELGDLSEAAGNLADAETITRKGKTDLNTANSSKTASDSTYSNAKTTANNASAALKKSEEQAKNDNLEWNGTLSGAIPAAKSVKAKTAKKKVTVSWKKLDKKKLKKFDKVEIQVCTDKGFARTNTIRKEVKKSKKSVKIKLKSKMTYYVRVRNVKGSGTTKLVSKWSKPKKIKIK